MRHHLLGQTAMEVRYHPDPAPEEHLLYDPGDERSLMKMSMDDVGALGPSQEKNLFYKEEIEDNLLPVWTRFQFLVPKQESPDTADVDMRSEMFWQVLTDMVRSDRHLMTTLFEGERLFEDTDMSPPIRKKRRRRHNKNIHLGNISNFLYCSPTSFPWQTNRAPSARGSKHMFRRYKEPPQPNSGL